MMHKIYEGSVSFENFWEFYKKEHARTCEIWQFLNSKLEIYNGCFPELLKMTETFYIEFETEEGMINFMLRWS